MQSQMPIKLLLPEDNAGEYLGILSDADREKLRVEMVAGMAPDVRARYETVRAKKLQRENGNG